MYNEKTGLTEGHFDRHQLALFHQMSCDIKANVPLRSNSPAYVWELLFGSAKFDLLSPECRSLVLGLAQSLGIPKKQTFEKIWVVESDFQSVNPSVLPFLPHFDIKRTTKIMVYLSDVTVKDGPMYIARNVAPSHYEARRQKVVTKGQNLVDAAEVRFEPLLGQAGHFHIFDTNLPHYAGTPITGGKRNILRLDFVH